MIAVQSKPYEKKGFCKYIRRKDERLKAAPHESEYELALYSHGTHFVFPEGMVRQILPVGSSLMVRAVFRAGRQYPQECRAARLDIDARVTRLRRRGESPETAEQASAGICNGH
ncbi:MAG: hypothetical protein ACI4D3_14100 [Lachnospiraceae bacterium]